MDNLRTLARFAGWQFISRRSWGLRPRLYAFACSAGHKGHYSRFALNADETSALPADRGQPL